jgi:type II secretory pathway pseudopilin PulG
MSGSRAHPKLTVAELLIVVFVLAAIAAVGVPRISRSAELARENDCRRNAVLLNTAIELYARENGGIYPADANAFKTIILDNLQYLPEGAPVCPMGGQYRYDPATRRAFCSHSPDR